MAKAKAGNGKSGAADEIARAVGAGKTAVVKTVDFANPARDKTCI